MSLLRAFALGLALTFAASASAPPPVHAEAKVRVKKKAKAKAKARRKAKRKKPAPAESQYKLRVEDAPKTYRFDAEGRPIPPKGFKKPAVKKASTAPPDEIDGIAPLEEGKTCENAACGG